MGLHGVGLAGGEGDGLAGHVDGFDADELVPAVEVNVGHLGPGIPDDGVVGVLLGNGNGALHGRIMNRAGGGGVEVDAVGGGGDAHGTGDLGFDFEVVFLIDVVSVVEALDGDFMDILDVKVGVHALFIEEGLGSQVGYGELELEGLAYGDLVGEAKVVEAQGTGQIGRALGEGQVEIFTGQGGEIQIPVLGAREAVHRAFLTVVAWAKPREEERNASADGLSGSHVGFVAEEDDGLLAGGLPVEEVSSLEAETARGGRGCDVDEEEVVLLAEGEGTGDGEVVGEGGEGLVDLVVGGRRHSALRADFGHSVHCRAWDWTSADGGCTPPPR